jgi:hypothetical protein
MRSQANRVTRREPATPAARRVRAIRSFLLDRDPLLLALASHLGGTDAIFESAIRGDSMSPAIPGGARLRVRLRSEQPCPRGEIVYYLSNDRFVVHRIVYRARRGSAAGYSLTIGDNCLIPDPPVLNDRILGTVIAIQTNTGWGPPGALVHASVYHRLARAAASGAVIVALRFSASAARRLTIILKRLESALRAPIGRSLRRLHLIPTRR